MSMASAASNRMGSEASAKKKKSNFASNLKTDMQFVRDESKKSQAYMQTLEKDNFQVSSLAQHQDFLANIKMAQTKAENCIEIFTENFTKHYFADDPDSTDPPKHNS